MELTLIYPHQLFADHPSIQAGRPVVLLEDPLLFGTDPQWPGRMHRQRALLHRLSMQAYADRLRRQGLQVTIQRHNQASDASQHITLLWRQGFRVFHLVDPVDDLLERRLRSTLDALGGKIVLRNTPMLLTPPEVVDNHFGSGRKPLMARFYEMQRKRMGVLLNPDGSPVGGRWSFDAENRKKLPKGVSVPPEPTCSRDCDQAGTLTQLESEGLPLIGASTPCLYPIDHQDAEAWLDRFLEERFEQFGDYEDAISRHHRVMWHGILTPMLNNGLLTPDQVLRRAIEAGESRSVPLNSLEGFVRQIIGWREFMAAMYRRHGRQMRTTNFWQFEDHPLPQAFYTGQTGLPPVDDAIHHALDTGWCHHIERLMLIGNLMLLCDFHPNRIYQWFMDLFVDAYDWVMVPNVYGMSQFADGGLFTTKPYVSGSNYVRKMSDYPKGDWCEIWDGLFWSFIHRHQNYFRGQYRLAMMARNLDKMTPEVLKAHQEKASQFLDGLS
ncbi:MAG: cryptochrome/photolyase family protein [Synechococcus sp.]